MLSAKTPSPAERRREAFTESFLSVKPSTRGKPPSPRGTSLSAKASNPVVRRGEVTRAFIYIDYVGKRLDYGVNYYYY
jgi:hypothetical protein